MSDDSGTASSFDISSAAVVACRMLLANPIPVLSASLRVIHLVKKCPAQLDLIDSLFLE